MTYLLFTILLDSGCHADGPFIRHDRDGKAITFCSDRYELHRETITGFRTLEACEREARVRWHESHYRTASRCGRSK